MSFETRSARLWKRLSREERLAAATHFFEKPSAELLGSAEAAIIKARRLRPQVARGLLKTFLDSLGLAHEDGVLTDEDEAPPIAEDPARRAVTALAAAFPREEVLTYLNALWLQDPDRWQVLEHAPDWLPLPGP